jgi:hypothetical protein
MFCAWCGPAFILFFMIGLLIAGFVPPPAASLTAQQIADVYRTNTDMVRLGVVIAFCAAVLYMPFIVVISVQLQRLEGRHPILAFIQMSIGVASMMILLLPPLLMIVAAYRPERAPEITQVINDLAWIMIIITLNTFMVQYIAIAVAIFRDRSRDPVFPRWAAYINLWICFMFLPGPVLAFVHDGPFAWDGLLCFWAPLTAFTVWFLGMFVALRQAIQQQVRVERFELVNQERVCA